VIGAGEGGGGICGAVLCSGMLNPAVSVLALLQVVSFAPTLMISLSIAMGVDYNLFQLTRFMDGVRAKKSLTDSIIMMLESAGKCGPLLLTGSTARSLSGKMQGTSSSSRGPPCASPSWVCSSCPWRSSRPPGWARRSPSSSPWPSTSHWSVAHATESQRTHTQELAQGTPTTTRLPRPLSEPPPNPLSPRYPPCSLSWATVCSRRTKCWFAPGRRGARGWGSEAVVRVPPQATSRSRGKRRGAVTRSPRFCRPRGGRSRRRGSGMRTAIMPSSTSSTTRGTWTG
jgi:hypothetical protein